MLAGLISVRNSNVTLTGCTFPYLHPAHHDTLSSADTASVFDLASRCPETDGAVVLQARALAGMVTGIPVNYPYACGADTSTARGGDIGSKSGVNLKGQSYSLYPNPTSGAITVTQYLWDDRNTNIRLLDAFGKTVRDYQVAFTNLAYRLPLGKLPGGMYLLHITNADGNMFNLKFEME
jgi:Secretion system C-terminal sorting domain